ncbi:MAG: transglycosylase SLT domain-containing protein, partial [Candidatus Caenarcaniphilales bacterium]|nr:transglycosylase SLT domain-containing protein [Candidatus Caenarcaniphilales bacterium]
MKKLLKPALLFGFTVATFGLNHSATAIDFEVGSFINDKVEESITSPVRRMKYKASNRIQSIKSKFSSRSRHTTNSEESEDGSYTARSNSTQRPSNSVVLSKEDNAPSSDGFQPEMSPSRSSGQYEAQIDEMVLAQWQRPAKVSPQDWEQILISAKRISKKTGIPQQLIMSLVNKESGFNPNIVSRSGAVGLTQ